MTPHIVTVIWTTKCPQCPLVLHKGDKLYVDQTHAYCMDCYAEREHCVRCDKDINSQARNYVNNHKSFCWDCATFDPVDHHFKSYESPEWRR